MCGGMTVGARIDSRLVSDFGARLRAFREAAGLTQQELADRVRCSRKQVGRWEAGETLPQRARLAHLEPPLGLVPGTLSEVLESLDYQARGNRMRRVGRLFEEGFGAHTLGSADLASQALVGWAPQPGHVPEGRLTTWTELAEALIRLAAAGSQCSPEDRGSVTLISGAWMARHIDRSNAKKRWKLAIQALLASGWGIRHLWVGTEVPSFEEWIVDFLGFEGRYELFTIGRGGGALPFVLLDIPGFGGVFAFVRRDEPDVMAWVSTRSPIVDFVHDAATYTLAAAQLEPSRQFVQYEGYEDVAPALTHARLELEIQCAIGEKLPGEQLILEDGLSTASQPEDVALQLREYRLARANSEQAAALRDYYEARFQRIRRFEEAAADEGIRAISSLEAIDEFMTTGSWPLDLFRHVPGIVESPQLRKVWIENVIRLLRAHPRTFKLALVDRQTRPLLRRAYWKTVGDRCLFFGVGVPGTRSRAYGHSFDRGVVTRFCGIFEDLWEALPGSAHDPRLVIARLERAIKHGSQLGRSTGTRRSKRSK